jgi:cobalamin biosynthetic protein CobC
MPGVIPHGGRLAAAQADYPFAPRPWLDLSTGINPDGWRGARARASHLTRLPDPQETAALEAAAAQAFGCDPSRVAAVPGAEAGLRLLPELLDVERVAIASPTYGSHADAWREAGREVVETDRDTLFAQEADAIVVVNPNNPDGRVSSGIDLIAQARGRCLIVDESFIEMKPDLSAASLVDDRTVVLRSFGKFYGLAGVRLGFVVAEVAFAARVRRRAGDWPVSAEAIVMGRAAYADRAWAERTRRGLARASVRLDHLLRGAGFVIEGGTDLFRLARCDDGARRAGRLAELGILVRTFPHDADLIRFGLPGRSNWRRLRAALEMSR